GTLQIVCQYSARRRSHSVRAKACALRSAVRTLAGRRRTRWLLPVAPTPGSAASACYLVGTRTHRVPWGRVEETPGHGGDREPRIAYRSRLELRKKLKSWPSCLSILFGSRRAPPRSDHPPP